MKRNIVVPATIVLAILWASSVAAAQVTFARAKQDIQSYWKKNWSTETILEVNAAGAGIASEKIINLKKVPYYSVPARVRVKRADGSVANFKVSAIYKKPGTAWVFEDVGTGAVEQEKATGQEPPPFEEAEGMIRKGWMDKFSAEGDTEITIHKVHPDPKFKAYGQRVWYTYKIDVDYRSSNARYQCKGQEARLVRQTADAPWMFEAMKDINVCQGQNVR